MAADLRSADVTAAIEAGHDDLYAIADHLGADVEQVRLLLADMVVMGWLHRTNDHGVTRWKIAERSRA